MTEGEGSVASVGGHCACALRLSALCSRVRLLVAVISQCSATFVDISFFFSFFFCFCSCVPGAGSPMSRSASPVRERAQETADTGFTEAQLAAITSVVRGVLKESQGPRAAEEGGGAGEASGSRSDGAAGEWGRQAGRWVESAPRYPVGGAAGI